MSAIRNLFNKMRPSFEEGGKLHAFRSVFDGFETFALVPNDTSKTGVAYYEYSGYRSGTCYAVWYV